MHAVKITNSENQSYKILSYYAPQSKPQQLKILSEEFKKEVENSDIAVGDLNKSLSTQPYRHGEYLDMLDQFERTELLEPSQNTFIPHVIGQTAATTQPDSVMTANTYTEELTVLSRGTLSSDHLALLIETDYIFDKIDNESLDETYYAYSSLDPARMQVQWDRASDELGEQEVMRIWSEMLLEIKRTGVKKEGCEFEYLK